MYTQKSLNLEIHNETTECTNLGRLLGGRADILGEDGHHARVQIRHQYLDRLIRIGLHRCFNELSVELLHIIVLLLMLLQLLRMVLLHQLMEMVVAFENFRAPSPAAQRVQMPAVAIDRTEAVGAPVVKERVEKGDLLVEAAVRRHLQLRALVVFARVEQILDLGVAGNFGGQA